MQSELPSRLGFSGGEADHKPAGPCVPFSSIFSLVDLINVNFENLLGEDVIGDLLDGRHFFALVSVSPFTASLTQVLRRSQNPRVANRKILDRA